MALGKSDERTTPVYVGTCVLFRTLPRVVLVLAALFFVTGSPVGALLVAAVTVLVAAILPWRFEVYEDGVRLSFAFREGRFFSKHDVAIRADASGSVLLPTASARRGYALVDGLLEPRRELVRAVFRRHGFRFA